MRWENEDDMIPDNDGTMLIRGNDGRPLKARTKDVIAASRILEALSEERVEETQSREADA